MQHNRLSDTTDHTREDWIERFWTSGVPADRERLAHAIDCVWYLQDNQRGKPLPKSLEVANILLGLQVDQETLLAALLSDYRLINKIDLTIIRKEYSPSVARLVESVQQLHIFVNCNFHEDGTVLPVQAESLRRMLLAIVTDVRAVLIKLAWRLQHLRILSDYRGVARRNIAQEALDVFTPLANRLGVSQLKWEMEDLAFRYLEPDAYKAIAKQLQSTRRERENYVDQFVATLQDLVDTHQIPAKVYGRPKHIYSIWKKMKWKNLRLDQLYDLRAVRVMVDDVEACYRVLGLVHARWLSIPSEFDDYITRRKPNGYQSLHTVIMGPEAKQVEVQIRTHDMHLMAELGVAAHWRYKEGGSQDEAMEKAIASLRGLLDNNQQNNHELLEDFHAEVFADRVFVLTPKGDVLDLPKGSTPIDMAYAIHTKIGHRCRGALVNGKLVNLDYCLQNGQQVEILTGKEDKPKRDWVNPSLGYAFSSRAKKQIRHWFRQQNHEKNYQDGLAFLEQERHRLGLPSINREALAKHFHKNTVRDFLIDLGRSDINITQLTEALLPKDAQKDPLDTLKLVKLDTHKSPRGIQVKGVDNVLTQISKCCQPLPGDAITGFITLGRGVSIHRIDCPNITHLTPEQQTRLIDVSWGDDESHSYIANILVKGLDQPGLLRDVADVLLRERINITNVDSRTVKNKAHIQIGVQIRHAQQLAKALDKISQLSQVEDAKRQN
ncbi:MAG: RelA/SpoT family protein [bacterium]